jgi:hypothetical protein
MPRKYLALPGYLIALSLIFFPIFDSVLSIWPPQPGQVAWRFGAVGLLSRAVMTPLLGLFIAYCIALVLEHRAVLRVISVVSVLAVIAVVGGLGIFGLDALQMRSQVVAQAKKAFDAASVTAVLKYLFSVVMLLAFAWGGWKGARGGLERRRTREAAGRESPLLVGARPPAQG